MNKHGLVRLSLAAGIAMAAFGAPSLALAGTPSPQQVPPPPTAAPPVTAPTQAYPLPAPAQQPPSSPSQPTQQLPPPPARQGQMPASAQQANAAKFLPGTQSSATYPIQNGTLTVNTGMPEHVQSYGSPPAFKLLDTNHDGRIDENEAQAYPPLDSDFLYASNNGKSISHTQYAKWVQGQH